MVMISSHRTISTVEVPYTASTNEPIFLAPVIYMNVKIVVIKPRAPMAGGPMGFWQSCRTITNQ